jgi:putative ABC transport system ATP-binding protein
MMGIRASAKFDSRMTPIPSQSNSSVASTPNTLMSIRGVSRVFQMGEVEVVALRDASLDLRAGEFLVVLGQSGSGKSTLLNLIGGMDRPTSGEILFDGRDLAKAGDAELTRFRRYSVGFVFQFYNLVPSLTAVENVQVSTELARKPMDPMEALGLVELTDRADHFPSQLSGGEQQRVSIARAVVKNPRLMLCDEPTGALDIETGKHILKLLMRLKSELGQTIVFITHNRAIAPIADRVATLRDGVLESVRVNASPLSPDEVNW